MADGDQDQEALASGQLDWWEAWVAAWEATAETGGCDYLGGREYIRVTGEALIQQLPPSQSAMRLFIRRYANIGPRTPITELSLARRVAKLNTKRKGG